MAVEFDIAKTKAMLAHFQRNIEIQQELKAAGVKIPIAIRRPKIGFIYFIQEHNGLIKIGWATDPLMRLAALQTASPEPLSLIGCIRGDKEKEGELHRLFRQLRIRGEWFANEPHLIQYIKEMDCRREYGIR